MIDVSFERGKDGYVAEFDAPGSILMQIQGEKGGRLSMYQYIQGMPPAKIDTREFDNSLIQVNLIVGLKVRLESDVKVVACKYIQMPQAGAAGGACDCEPYTLPTATASVLGGLKIGFSQTAKKYPVVLDGEGKAYVEVPWTDTNTTYKAATKESLGLVKQLAFVQNATGADDAHTKLNQILEDMKTKGVMASS